MDVEVTIKTKRNLVLRVNLSDKGDWHVFNAKGELVQRYDDFDIANMAVWLLDRNAEDGPFTVREVKSQAR